MKKITKHTKDMISANVMLGTGNVVLGAMGQAPIKGTGMLGVVSTAGYAGGVMQMVSKMGKK